MYSKKIYNKKNIKNDIDISLSIYIYIYKINVLIKINKYNMLL